METTLSLVQLEQELQQSRAMFRSVVDQNPDVIFVLDASFNIEYTNRVTAGKSLAEIVGQSFFEYVSPAYREHAEPAFHEAARRGGKVIHFETQGLRHDGSVGYWSSRIVPIVEDGVIVRYTQIAADITELKQAQDEQLRLKQDIIAAQRQAILELSTPIIPIMERIIILPLIGSITPERAREMLRAMLAGIQQYRAKIVLMELTGVPSLDSEAAQYLHKCIQAARLKGARTFITGMADDVAITLVELGIDWNEMETLQDLRSGLRAAMTALGVTL
jgi:rsbT co-antagonist protein RsbR